MKSAMKFFLLRRERFPLVQLHGYRMTIAVCSVSQYARKPPPSAKQRPADAI